MNKRFTTFLMLILAVLTATAQEHAIYVKPQGDDNADGSMAAPVRTLSRALAMVDDSTTHIYMAAGTYTESQTLELRSNLTIEGGYDGNTWQVGTSPTNLSVSSIEYVSDYSHKMAFRSASDTNWTLRRLTIVVPSATDAERSSSGKGATVYGIHVSGASTGNRVVDCQIVVGNGGNGVIGSPGTAGVNGNNGTSGGDGGLSEWTNDGDSEGIGGSAVGSGNRAGGRGGDGGEGSVDNGG
ncbi:MAG: DUF1565 domain-containing protein, partial [Bacteroidales bacterium]|nr:DUF1565 domain-containing protein [Bacteroidales bacterium]